ncbi:elongation factor Tu GTP binding domain-containing protein [Besnoitia besnoiti]|uniref:Elongation factor Tu GTP binding domain-containing protein n=1 Tax=Besnoitia besnoiti TaxID=94643 RepID=A0A2A9M630_BESBE|nr:elongation factor Tu GTP binding domain-containing protein [Besnoitia besnoiti]PFH31336.1 elongation factor Tu GTP binding domain-containing protein [Besnoitia besnoiti]
MLTGRCPGAPLLRRAASALPRAWEARGRGLFPFSPNPASYPSSPSARRCPPLASVFSSPISSGVQARAAPAASSSSSLRATEDAPSPVVLPPSPPCAGGRHAINPPGTPGSPLSGMPRPMTLFSAASTSPSRRAAVCTSLAQSFICRFLSSSLSLRVKGASTHMSSGFLSHSASQSLSSPRVSPSAARDALFPSSASLFPLAPPTAAHSRDPERAAAASVAAIVSGSAARKSSRASLAPVSSSPSLATSASSPSFPSSAPPSPSAHFLSARVRAGRSEKASESVNAHAGTANGHRQAHPSRPVSPSSLPSPPGAAVPPSLSGRSPSHASSLHRRAPAAAAAHRAVTPPAFASASSSSATASAALLPSPVVARPRSLQRPRIVSSHAEWEWRRLERERAMQSARAWESRRGDSDAESGASPAFGAGALDAPRRGARRAAGKAAPQAAPQAPPQAHADFSDAVNATTHAGRRAPSEQAESLRRGCEGVAQNAGGDRDKNGIGAESSGEEGEGKARPKSLTSVAARRWRAFLSVFSFSQAPPAAPSTGSSVGSQLASSRPGPALAPAADSVPSPRGFRLRHGREPSAASSSSSHVHGAEETELQRSSWWTRTRRSVRSVKSLCSRPAAATGVEAPAAAETASPSRVSTEQPSLLSGSHAPRSSACPSSLSAASSNSATPSSSDCREPWEAPAGPASARFPSFAVSFSALFPLWFSALSHAWAAWLSCVASAFRALAAAWRRVISTSPVARAGSPQGRAAAESQDEHEQSDAQKERVTALLEEARLAAARRAEEAERAAALRAAQHLQQWARPPSRTFREIRCRLLRQAGGAADPGGRLELDSVRELETQQIVLALAAAHRAARNRPRRQEGEASETVEAKKLGQADLSQATLKTKAGDAPTKDGDGEVRRAGGEQSGGVAMRHTAAGEAPRTTAEETDAAEKETREGRLSAEENAANAGALEHERVGAKTATALQGAISSDANASEGADYEHSGKEMSELSLRGGLRATDSEVKQSVSRETGAQAAAEAPPAPALDETAPSAGSAETQLAPDESVSGVEERLEASETHKKGGEPLASDDAIQGASGRDDERKSTREIQNEQVTEGADNGGLLLPAALRLKPGQILYEAAPKSDVAEALSSPLPSLDEWIRRSSLSQQEGCWNSQQEAATTAGIPGLPGASLAPAFLAAARQRLGSFHAAAAAAKQEAVKARQAAAAAAAEALTLSVQAEPAESSALGRSSESGTEDDISAVHAPLLPASNQISGSPGCLSEYGTEAAAGQDPREASSGTAGVGGHAPLARRRVSSAPATLSPSEAMDLANERAAAAAAAEARAYAAKKAFFVEEAAFRAHLMEQQKHLALRVPPPPEKVQNQLEDERARFDAARHGATPGTRNGEPRAEGKSSGVLAKVLGHVEPSESFSANEGGRQAWNDLAFPTVSLDGQTARVQRSAWGPYPSTPDTPVFPLAAPPGSRWGAAAPDLRLTACPASAGLQRPGDEFAGGPAKPGQWGGEPRPTPVNSAWRAAPHTGTGPGGRFPFAVRPPPLGAPQAPASASPLSPLGGLMWDPRAPDIRWLKQLYGEIHAVKEVTKFYRGGRGLSCVEESKRALGLILMSLNVEVSMLQSEVNKVVTHVRPAVTSWEQVFSAATRMIQFFAHDTRFGKDRCLVVVREAGGIIDDPRMSQATASSGSLAEGEGSQPSSKSRLKDTPDNANSASSKAAELSEAPASSSPPSTPSSALPSGSSSISLPQAPPHLHLSLQEPATRMEALLVHFDVVGRLPPVLLPGQVEPIAVKAFFSVPRFLNVLRRDIYTLNCVMHALKRENVCTLDDGSSISLWDPFAGVSRRPSQERRMAGERTGKAQPTKKGSRPPEAKALEEPSAQEKNLALAKEKEMEEDAAQQQSTTPPERKQADTTALLLQSMQRQQEERRLADLESFSEASSETTASQHWSRSGTPSGVSSPDDASAVWLAEASTEQLQGTSALSWVERQTRTRKLESKKKQGETQRSPREGQEKHALHVNDLTIETLARHLNVPDAEVLGVAALLLEGTPGRGTVTLTTRLDEDEAEFLSDELGKLHCLRLTRGEAHEERGDYRAPAVVAVLGHVDHGKTTLLDKLRSTHVAESEAGGITQAVSSGSLLLPSQNQRLTFIDTPGHAAFASMRKRGAAATDLCVLVVAADEGVKAQTLECLEIIRKAGTPWIVAMNKMDKQGADPERVKQQFADLGVLSDDAGGDVPFIPISAKSGEGLDQLEAALTLLQEDMPHLYGRGPPTQGSGPTNARSARGYVLESRVDKQKGRCIQVIVRSGWLEPGKWVVIGRNAGRVKKIWRSGEQVELTMAGPNEAVEITGLGDLQASAGQALVQATSAQQAAKLAGMVERLDLRRQMRRAAASTAEATKFAVEDLALKTASTLRRKQRKLLKYKQAVQDVKTGGETVDEDAEEDDMEDLITTRHAVVEGIPQIGFVIKAADQGSLEAILQWIDTFNETVKTAERLPDAVRGALKTAAADRLRALADQRRAVDLTEEVESEEQPSEALDESERSLVSRWLPLCVLHCGVGPISLSDVNKASLTNSFILGFGVSTLDNIDQVVHEKGLTVRNQNIIYRLFEDIEAMYEYHFGSEFVYNQVGRAVVSRVATFTLKRSKGGVQTVVGVDVKEGTPSTQHFYTVIRDGLLVAENLQVKSMQKNRQDVTSLQKGSRLGAIIFDSDFDDFEERDTILVFERSQRLPPEFITSRRYIDSA